MKKLEPVKGERNVITVITGYSMLAELRKREQEVADEAEDDDDD